MFCTYGKILVRINLSLFSTVDNCPSQDTEVTSTPTRPVENVVITKKGLQERNNLLLYGWTVENKGKLIVFEIIVELFEIMGKFVFNKREKVSNQLGSNLLTSLNLLYYPIYPNWCHFGYIYIDLLSVLL